MQKSNPMIVNQHVLLNFEIDKTYIDIGNGHAVYHMNRGSFKTKDKISNKKRLFYTSTFNHEHMFTDGKTQLVLSIEKDDYLRLKFKVDGDYNRLSLFFNSSEQEKFYGCGEQFSKFNLKGQKVNIWVNEHHSLKKLLFKFLREKICGVNPDHVDHFKHQQTYYAQPTFISSHRYFVHAHTQGFASFEFKKDQTVLHFREIPEMITIGESDTFLNLAGRLSHLLGKQPFLPSWTEKGAILAIQGGTDTLRQKINEAQTKGIDIVGVWSQDWSGHLITAFGYQVNWNWQVDDVNYHDLKELIVELNQKGIRFLGYINTFLKENSNLYLVAKQHGFLVLNSKREPYLVQSTTFKAGIVDLTYPMAFEWYKQLIKENMIGLGMSGWMADFGEYLPTDAIIYEGRAEDVHNTWPTLWAKCNHEAIIESNQENEVFFFSRAAYTQTMQYTNAMWCGDQHVDYSKAYGLPSVITASLGMSTIGNGIIHSDIGGYTTLLHMKRTADLMMRWTEMNVFSPLFRCHEGNKPDVNVQYDDPLVIHHFARMSRIFKTLSPYLHDLKKEYEATGIPVIRPVFYHYDEMKFYTMDTAYMYGAELYVAPVTKPNITVFSVILPEGNWIHLFSKESYTGGIHQIEVPYGKPAVFYRANSPYQYLFDVIE
jgi:sulfoquinovosidase